VNELDSLNAAEARRLAKETAERGTAAAQLASNSILALIKTAAETEASTSLTLASIGRTSAESNMVQKLLRDRGFAIKFTGDQRDGDFWTISW
jgi:hypothetical protein